VEHHQDGTIQDLALSSVVANASLFADRFLRDAAGNLVAIDRRWINAGETVTEGVDINAGRASSRLNDASWSVRAGRQLPARPRSRACCSSAPFSASEVGVFTFRAGDLGPALEAQPRRHLHAWRLERHAAAPVPQWLRRSTCCRAWPPGVVPPNWKPKVKAYQLWNTQHVLVRHQEPDGHRHREEPARQGSAVSVAYDSNTGAGSSWEPRVADPRGRSLVLTVGYRF
jgi:iron complex outermembrane receptor protein